MSHPAPSQRPPGSDPRFSSGFHFPKDVQVLDVLQKPMYILDMTWEEGALRGRVLWASGKLCEMLCVKESAIQNMEMSRLCADWSNEDSRKFYEGMYRKVQFEGVATERFQHELRYDGTGEVTSLQARALPMKIKTRHSEADHVWFSKSVVLMDLDVEADFSSRSSGGSTTRGGDATSAAVHKSSEGSDASGSGPAARAPPSLEVAGIRTVLFGLDGRFLSCSRSATEFYLDRIRGGGNKDGLDASFDIDAFIRTCVWQSQDESAESFRQRLMCMGPGSELRIDCQRAPAISGSFKEPFPEVWSVILFSSVVDPASGQPAILASETDVSEIMADLKKLKVEKEMRESFLLAITHDLRTPLNGILGLCEVLISDKNFPANLAKTLQAIRSSGHRLSTLVSDIIDCSALRGGLGITIKHEEVDVGAVVQSVCEMLAPLVGAQVEMTNHVSPDVPSIVGDAGRVAQVVTNLLGNSAKFTHKGFIKASVMLNSNRDSVVIEVEDQGIGIPREKINAVFEPFKQADEATTRKYGGTGLGLTLVKSLVHAHHGTIEVSSRYGGKNSGSKFVVALPIKQPQGAPAISSADAPADFPLPHAHTGSKSEVFASRQHGRTFDLGSDSTQTSHSSDRNTAEHLAKELLAKELAQMDKAWSKEKAEMQREMSALRSRLRGVALASGTMDRPQGTENQYGTPQRISMAPAEQEMEANTVVSRTAMSATGTSNDIMNMLSKTRNDARIGDFQGGGIKNHFEVYGTYEILSVDDNIVNQLVIERILVPRGYKVVACMDGSEALDYLADKAKAFLSGDAGAVFPDLVLLDCMMPKINGYECCNIMRVRYQASQLPVIMFSAKSGEDSIIEGLDSGANDYITKPFGQKELLSRINTLLKLKSMWCVELEHEKSKTLLKRMLPDHIIRRLQEGQQMCLDYFPNVTILFSDIVGYTELAASAPLEEVIEMLNQLFTAFDRLCDIHNVYKVETIGDCYMVVGGMDGSPKHAESVLRFAVDMLFEARKVALPGKPSESVQVRVGIHSGKARAGVVGTKMPRYTFFGDTVNTAARMESNSAPVSILLSNYAYTLVRDLGIAQFLSVPERQIKGKGPMVTHLVDHVNCRPAAEALNLLMAGMEVNAICSITGRLQKVRKQLGDSSNMPIPSAMSIQRVSSSNSSISDSNGGGKEFDALEGEIRLLEAALTRSCSVPTEGDREKRRNSWTGKTDVAIIRSSAPANLMDRDQLVQSLHETIEEERRLQQRFLDEKCRLEEEYDKAAFQLSRERRNSERLQGEHSAEVAYLQTAIKQAESRYIRLSEEVEEISDQRDGAIEKGIAMEMELSKCRVQLRVLSWELSKRSSETSIGDDFSSSFSDRGTDPAS